MIGRSIKLSIYIGFAGIFSSCMTVSDIKPEDYLNHARELIQKQQFQLAKLYVDSVRICFPKEFNKIREGIRVMREIHFAEQSKTLAFCDSMLRVRQTQLPDIQKNFKFEKNEDYETIGHYVHRSQLSTNLINSTYLQSKVDERGNLFVTSYYCGSKPIKHQAVSVSAKDGTYAASKPVPADGALNYTFTNDGLYHEIVRFDRNAENGIVGFILHHKENNMQVKLSGQKMHVYKINVRDIKAMQDAYDLSAVLSDITRLLDEIRMAQAKLEYIRQKQQGIPENAIQNE